MFRVTFSSMWTPLGCDFHQGVKTRLGSLEKFWSRMCTMLYLSGPLGKYQYLKIHFICDIFMGCILQNVLTGFGVVDHIYHVYFAFYFICYKNCVHLWWNIVKWYNDSNKIMSLLNCVHWWLCKPFFWVGRRWHSECILFAFSFN